MNGGYVDMFGKYNVGQVMEDVVDIKGMIEERKGKIEEMIIKNIHSKCCMRNGNSNCNKGNNNVFNLFQKASKTFNNDNSKYKTPFKQTKMKSMLMLLSPTSKRNNIINTQRSIKSAFTSTKCSLFSRSTKNVFHTKPTNANVLSRFNTLSNDNNKKHKPKRKRNITLTLTSSPSIPRTQSMFYTITTQCKKQYKRSLNISTSITNKYKRNLTQTRNKHIYKGNQQDIQALTENIINDDLNTKQIVNLDIKHVDKLSTESVYKNRNLYINSLSHDDDTTKRNNKHDNTNNNGASIYSTATHNNYLHNKSLFINHFRQLNTQKSFYIVERLLRLNTKYKEKLIKLTKRITTSKQHHHQHRLQSV